MTRLHHSLVKGLAQDLREAGLNADVEITMADLHTVKPEGGIVEARMDLMVTRAGGVHSWPIDLRTIDSYSAHGFASLEKAMAGACKRKRRRYRGRVWPMVIDTRGGLFHETCELLETLASEAAMMCRAPPSLLVRRWRRRIELIAAFEWAETLRASRDPRRGDDECTAGTAAQ